MNQRPAEPGYGIGGCGSCRQVFLLTPADRTCPLCDGPPLQALEFPAEGPQPLISRDEAIEHFKALGYSQEAAERNVDAAAPAPAAAAEPPVPFTVACPHCSGLVQLLVTEEAITVAETVSAPPEEPLEAPAPEPEPPAPPATVEEEPQEPMVAPQDGPPVES